MLNAMLGLPEDPLWVFLTLCIGGVSYYFILASISYLLLFKVMKRRFHPEYVPDPKDIRRSIKWSVISILGNAVLTAPIHYLIAKGYSKIYFDIADYGWGWVGISAVLVLLITETLIYWTHRWLHGDFLFHNVHNVHHSFRVTTSWAGVAFNPLDSFAQALPHHLCAFLLPMHVGLYLGFVGFVTLWAIMIHDRVTLVRWSAINYTGHHTLHHWYSDYNYGQFFTFWDRLMGTYRSPVEARSEVPEAVMASS